MAKWTASKLEKLRANVINGDDDEEEVVKGNWTPSKLEKLRGGIIEDMGTRGVPNDTRLFSHEDEQSLQDLANLESTTGIGSASSDINNSPTSESSFAKFTEMLSKYRDASKNPFEALNLIGEGISKGISMLDPNGDKALLTEEQKVNYANNNLSNLSEEDLNKLRQFAEQSDNRDINIINSLSLGATGDTSSAMRMANAKKEQDEIKQEMQERLGIDDETFNKYVASVNYLRNLEDRKKQQEELANADAGTMTAANVASILTAPIRSAFSVAGYVNEYANPYRDENFDVDHNAMAFDVANFNKDTTQQTSKDIDENVDSEAGKFALQTLYQGGKSGIESMLRLGTVGQAGTIVEAGLEAYDNAREEAQERGLTKTQAIETAMAQGMAEAAFEVLPVENLGKLFKQGGEVAAKGVKNVFKEIGKQSAFEGLEEVETNLANLLTDAMINKDKSEFNVKVEDYKAQGMDEDEAFKTTLMDTVTDNVQAFLGGAVGGLLGGGTAVGSNVAMQTEAKKLDGNYREVAQAIPDNVEDYNSEEDYNTAMEVKARAEELDTQDKVSSADRSGLLQDIYAINETMPNVDLIENINESVNSPFADVGGFQVTKNDITSQKVAQSMSQANNVNDFVEAYRDSQASSNVDARQTGQEYFETLAPKFDTYDEGSRPLDIALTQRSAEDLYTAALNGEEVAQEELNTQKKQQLFQRGMLENTVNQRAEVQRQARREEQKTFEPAQLHNIETPQGKADIADITLDNDGNFKWTKGEEEVIVPRKDISDNAMQRFMVNALNQPTLSAKQLYIDNYDGSLPIGSYNNAYESAFNAGQLNSKNFKGWLGSHKFYAKSIPESTLEAFFNEGAKQVENKSKKVTSAKTKGTGKVTAEKSVENTPIHKLAQAFASKTGIDVEIRDGSILVTDGAQNALTDAEGNEIYSNGQFQADISKVIVGANGKELQTFMHEAIGEVLEAYNPEDMADIQDAILNYLLESKGDNYVDKTIKRYQRLYQAAEGTKSYRDAANEMINDTLVGLFTTDKGANDFVNWCTKNDKSVLEKITDFIQAIIDKLKSLISDANLSSEARTVAEMSEKQAQKIRDRLFKAMDKAIDNYKGAEEGKADTSTRNSLDIDEELDSMDIDIDLLNEWFASDEPTKTEKKEAVKFGEGYDFIESGNKKLAYTEDRINYLLDAYAASDPNYAQAYVAYINPIDFLKLTTGANQRAMERIEREGKKLNLEELREETQPLYLNIDEEEGEVIGHEGRHRMYALYREGYTRVPILLFNYQNKYSKQNIDSIDLLPQWFSEKDDNLSDRITVTNLIPFSRGNEEEIRTQYGKGTSADARFSLDVDSEGNELTEGQQDFFKDSKIRDEQGRLKVMFHGTQDAGFTVFDTDYSKDNISLFFTDDETVAKGYSSSRRRLKFNYTLDDLRGMLGSYEKIVKSGDTYKLQERTPSDKINTIYEGSFNDMRDYVVEMYGDINRSGNYAVYLNATNPYIVDAQGNNFDAIPHGKERWDTRQLAEYARNNGYDSLIINDVIDTALYASNEERIQESQIVVVFNSNQVKSVDNENPTESEDIRYSLDVPTTYALDDYDPFIDDDVTETKDSKEAFTNSIIKAANDVLNFNISDKQVSDIVDKMILDYSSTVDKDFVTKNLRNIFSAMNSDNIQDMTNALINLSEEVVRQSEEIDPDEQANYDDFIKNMPKIKLSEEQKNEAINRMGDWNTVFGAMGRFLSNDTTTTLDGNVYWQICDNALEHNYVMDRDANDADQLMNIIEAVENMRPQSRAIFEGGDITDAALVTANEIMQQYYGYALKDAQANANLKEVKADLKKQVDDYKRVIGKQYQERVNELNKQLRTKDNEIKQLRAFNTSEISKAISIEKARVATAEKNARADKTNLNKYIERQERNKYLKSIRNQAIRTIKMLENPTRNKFIPEVLQKPTIEMLQTFDFVTYRVRKNGELVPWGEEKGGEPTKTNQMWREKMEKLQGVLSNLEGVQDEEDLSKYGNNSSYLYNLSVQLGDVTKGLLDQFLQDTQKDSVKISTLNSEKLKVLDKFMKSYLASINSAQEAMIDGNNVQLAQVGQSVTSEISALKSLNAVAGTIKKTILDFLNLDMAEPITVFSELGGTMEKLYWHLEKGKDVRDGHIFDTEEAFIKAKEELNIGKNEPSKWETGLMSFKNGKLQLTPAQVMSLYAAYGRSQARHHIIFGGVMSSDEGLRGKDKKLKKVQTKPVHLTPKDVEDIVNTLKPEQKALADFMVDYMSNEVSNWGNRVSQKRWGIRLFTESHYFPIKTFDVTRPSRTMDENANASLFSLQNQGFTKPLQKDANNALVLEDIFKVFSDHVAKMAAYDGYVIPINDFMRVFNYAESEETFAVKQGEEGMHREDASVKEQIERVFGEKGTQYFTKFIKNVNEDFGEGGSINLIDKLFSNNKAQAVLANGRVVIQQPTAYPRAMEVIDGKYLVKALSTSAVGLKKKIQRSKSHNTLAKFKSKGYYETSIGQSMQQMITGTATPKDKVNEVAGALAGLADDFTWSVIYQAAEYKVQAEQKELEIDSKGYFDAVNKIANEAFVKTQVVDSVFTKSQMMRSRDTGDKMLTAFMAEPTKYYNMLHRGVFNMIQHGNKKAFAKAVYLFVIGQVLNSVAQSAYDAWRDDDDEKDAMEKFLNALLGISDIQEANGVWATMQAILKSNLFENLFPVNLLPVVKEVTSALAGWDSKNMSTQAIYDIVGDAQKIVNWSEGKGTLTPYGVLNTVAHSLSLATGMPISSALREVKDLYNNVNNLWDGTNLVKNEKKESKQDKAAKIFEENDSIVDGAKEVYELNLQEQLDKGKSQQDAEKQAKSDAKSAITTTYREKLVDLKENDMSEAVSLRAELVRAYTSLGDTAKQANSKIEKWFK